MWLNNSQMKRLILLSFAFSCSQILAQSGILVSDQYEIDIETETFFADCLGSEVLVHRVYLQSVNMTDQLSAVFGNDTKPLRITATGGVYNSDVNPGTPTPSGINPIFFDFFPCLPIDSYVTIGVDGSPDLALGEETVSHFSDSGLSPTILEFFSVNTFGQATELNVNTLTGGSWYSLNTASNSLPDEDGRWLVMQLTSAEHISGTLNFQIFPLGIGADQIQLVRDFNSGPPCNDPSACNFNANLSTDFIGEVDCDYSCCPGPGCCGEGTTWDSESQTCLTTYLHDADFDGCVGLSDLLSLLSVFGSCLEE
jgi:hypothetical protein